MKRVTFDNISIYNFLGILCQLLSCPRSVINFKSTYLFVPLYVVLHVSGANATSVVCPPDVANSGSLIGTYTTDYTVKVTSGCGSVTNSGLIKSGNSPIFLTPFGAAIGVTGAATTLPTLNNDGVIEGIVGSYAIGVEPGATITTLTNTGNIKYSDNSIFGSNNSTIYNQGTITSLTNSATGNIYSIRSSVGTIFKEPLNKYRHSQNF